MASLGETLKHLTSYEPLPDESTCPVCGYFDVSHPDVQRILLARDPTRQLLHNAQCRCQELVAQMERDEALRHIQANLPHPEKPRTFDRFTTRPGTEDALAASKRFATFEGPTTLFIAGETGTGKSHLLEAIGRQILSASVWHVRYETSIAFLDRLRFSYSDNHEAEDLMAWYQKQRYLLLDDLGSEKPTDWAIERLTTLIDERMVKGLPLAVSSNLGEGEMAARLGERLASRLFQTNPALGEVSRVTLMAGDYRKEHA